MQLNMVKKTLYRKRNLLYKSHQALSKQRIILGIDPGTVVMGYGIIQETLDEKQPLVVQYGVIKLHKYADHMLKLQKIFQRTTSLLQQFAPDEVAIEAIFYGKNVQSMLKLGRAQGIAIAAALACEIPVTEYAPRKVKQAVTGQGNASKQQVAQMLASLLPIQGTPDLLDASDALAVAMCHSYQKQQGGKKTTSWKQFLQEHPTRVSC